MSNIFPIINGTIFNTTKECTDELVGVTCEDGEVCGKYEIALTSPDVEAVGSASGCVDAGPAAEDFACSDESIVYRILHGIMESLLIANPVDPEIQCRMYLCYDDLCNTGHTAQVSLLVATLISLYQLF